MFMQNFGDKRRMLGYFQSGLLEGKTLNKNDLNQIADQQFLLKQWFY